MAEIEPCLDVVGLEAQQRPHGLDAGVEIAALEMNAAQQRERGKVARRLAQDLAAGALRRAQIAGLEGAHGAAELFTHVHGASYRVWGMTALFPVKQQAELFM